MIRPTIDHFTDDDGTIDYEEFGEAMALYDEEKIEEKREILRGDTVLVWDDEDDEKVKRIYLCTVAGAYGPHICVTKSHEQNFMSNRPFKTCGWDNCDRVL